MATISIRTFHPLHLFPDNIPTRIERNIILNSFIVAKIPLFHTSGAGPALPSLRPVMFVRGLTITGMSNTPFKVRAWEGVPLYYDKIGRASCRERVF